MYLSRISIAVLLFLAVASAQSLHGSGTTNPSKLFTDATSGWFEGFKAAHPAWAGASITYDAVGSGTGISDLIAVNNDFAAADVPLNNAEHSQLGSKVVLHIPFLLGAVNIFHNVPAASLGGNNLNLTGVVAAKIFQRNITTWDDAEILAINPNLVVPNGQTIIVVRRMDGSSSTNNLSQYLVSSAPDDWVLGSGKTLAWPDGTTQVSGSGGMSGALTANNWTIGYVDVGFGRSNGLNEVALQNKDGVFLTADEANVEAVATTIPSWPASESDTWDEITLINLGGADVWPITTFSYFLIYQDLTFLTREQGMLLIDLIEYTLTPAGQNLTEQFGFFPVPAPILTVNEAGLQTIVLTAAPSATNPTSPPSSGSSLQVVALLVIALLFFCL